MKKIFIKAAASALMTLSLASCADWLEVKMEDKIMEPVLFSNYSGYVSALNGVYISLNEYYTDGRLMNILDVMAQYYHVTDDNNHSYRLFQSFDFNDSDIEATNSTLWNQAYTLIAHTNTILDHLQDVNETPLTQSQFDLLRGEALAMRAMLHFDVLRRHGAIYATNPDAETIPYQDDTSREIKPFLTNKVIMEKIIADLTEAASLLKDSDPIITEGIRDTETEDNGVASYDMSFRQLRLNYYAVQGLLARAYQWTGDKANAYRIAKNEIIDKANTEDLEVFPWVTSDQVTAEGRPDKIFSPEVMFAVYNSQRLKFYNNTFSETQSLNSRLTFYGETIDDSKVSILYDYPNDFRRSQWEMVDPPMGAGGDDSEPVGTSLVLNKYQDFQNGATEATYRYIIPMIRMSEMYLIAAESTSDRNEAFDLLDEIRLHRNAPNVERDEDLNLCILYEFAREMVAEGQLYFFYKRRQESIVISRTGSFDYPMMHANYIWPIPESEINKRTQVK